MIEESTFVSIDNDDLWNDVVVIDMDDDYADFVSLDENSYDDVPDFITLSDDVEVVTDTDIMEVFAGADDIDVSVVV
ncbi:MAG: hypothetical protein LBR50_01235 [Tannerella sp.]|jgi:hypothetical protein|nr:hypothetical protein [Tannerella sp.]